MRNKSSPEKGVECRHTLPVKPSAMRGGNYQESVRNKNEGFGEISPVNIKKDREAKRVVRKGQNIGRQEERQISQNHSPPLSGGGNWEKGTATRRVAIGRHQSGVQGGGRRRQRAKIRGIRSLNGRHDETDESFQDWRGLQVLSVIPHHVGLTYGLGKEGTDSKTSCTLGFAN